MTEITRGPKKGPLKRNQIRPNQDYLETWDDYQLKHLNADAAAGKVSAPTLMPVMLGIKDGIVVRDRIKVPQLQTIMDKSRALAKNHDVASATKSYVEFFKGQDGSQSSTPPTPLDLEIARPTVKLFYLLHENWTYTDHTQFSVDNVPPGVAKNKMFDVLGTVDNGRGLLVLDHNWTHHDNRKKEKHFAAKYNLHVSIAQKIGSEMGRTDIIIDPWGNNNDDVDPN